MTLRGMSANANEEAETTATPQLPGTTQSVAVLVSAPVAAPAAVPISAAQIGSQKDSPLFSLPPELRNCIYAHLFGLVEEISNNGATQPIDLDILTITTASNALLQTCRSIYHEARGIFDRSPGGRNFFENPKLLKNLKFSINLSDDWEDEQMRAEEHFTVLDTIDEAFLLPELRDEQVNAMESLVIVLRSDTGNFSAHLSNQTLPCGTRYWELDENASTWGKGPSDLVTYSFYPVMTPMEVFHTIAHRQPSMHYLQAAAEHFTKMSIYAQGASGRRYKS